MTPLAIAVVAATYPAAPTLAQDAALEEIIVTAQKRTQNLQDVPISVQVLGHQQPVRHTTHHHEQTADRRVRNRC